MKTLKVKLIDNSLTLLPYIFFQICIENVSVGCSRCLIFLIFLSEFLTMCKELDVCPNIWSLYEWSDWLTPLHLKTKSRFDTMFYVASTDIANHRGSLDSLILLYLQHFYVL